MFKEFEEAVVRERMVIDFHIHPYRDISESLCMYSEDFYLTPQEARRDLEEAGIGRVCGSVIRAGYRGPVSGFDDIRRLNDAALEMRERWGDYYIPGFHVHPAYLRESLEEVERMHREDVKLVGELVPYIHGWKEAGHDYGSEALREILARAGEYGMPVSFHTMPEFKDQMERMIAGNPGVTFVAAHPGQKADYLMHVERLRKYPNLLLDISGTGLFRYGLLASAVKTVGADRLLFGTDYPISNPRMYVQAVLGEHISQEDMEKIFWKNTRKLLGL